VWNKPEVLSSDITNTKGFEFLILKTSFMSYAGLNQFCQIKVYCYIFINQYLFDHLNKFNSNFVTFSNSINLVILRFNCKNPARYFRNYNALANLMAENIIVYK